MTAKNLDKIFEPNNIALIGATEREGSVSLTLTNNLADRPEGETFPVNPNRESVLEIETFPSVRDIHDSIDLGVIATPAPTVPEIVEECGEAGIPAIVIISAGFSETGVEGRKLEEKNWRDEAGIWNENSWPELFGNYKSF